MNTGLVTSKASNIYWLYLGTVDYHREVRASIHLGSGASCYLMFQKRKPAVILHELRPVR